MELETMHLKSATDDRTAKLQQASAWNKRCGGSSGTWDVRLLTR